MGGATVDTDNPMVTDWLTLVEVASKESS